MVLLKPFRYCGEYYDKETDSIYLRARYYNPALGRFTTEDLAKDGLNWYVYCDNNPVMFVDPTGETLKDAVYGSLETLDSNIFSGAATLIAEWLTGQEYNYKPENQEHYYVGRVVGDVFSALAGAKMIETGCSIILGGLGAEGGLAVVTDGASIALLDGAIAVSLTTAGTITITYGGKTIVSSAKGLYDDVNKLIKLSNNVNSNVIVNNKGKNIDITPSKNHYTTNKNPGYIGEANSSIDILDSNGNIITRRWFDKNGKAIRDVDMTNHGNPKEHPEWPHEHIWQYGTNGKPKSR